MTNGAFRPSAVLDAVLVCHYQQLDSRTVRSRIEHVGDRLGDQGDGMGAEFLPAGRAIQPLPFLGATLHGVRESFDRLPPGGRGKGARLQLGKVGGVHPCGASDFSNRPSVREADLS